MWQTEVFGEKSGTKGWHSIPRSKTQRSIVLSEIKRLTNYEIQLPPDLLSGDTLIKLSHRGMLQLAEQSRYTVSVVLIKNDGLRDEEVYYCYSALLLKENSPQKETTIILGSRWKISKERIKIHVRYNGKLILNCYTTPSKTKIKELDSLPKLKPGDVLEVCFLHKQRKFDRISLNFGIKKSA